MEVRKKRSHWEKWSTMSDPDLHEQPSRRREATIDVDHGWVHGGRSSEEAEILYEDAELKYKVRRAEVEEYDCTLPLK